MTRLCCTRPHRGPALRRVQYAVLLAALALACPRLPAQQPDNLQQLVGQIKAEYGLTARVEEVSKGEVLIILMMSPPDTLKFRREDRQKYAHRVALFARAHFTRAGSAAFITVQLVTVQDTDKGRELRDLGAWYWDTQYIGADSVAPPDVLKGSKPRRPAETPPSR
jgi:hypothetical protein